MPVIAVIILILMLLAAAVLFAMKPSQDNLRKKLFKSFEVHYIAHRGLHDERYDAPENTMRAFRRAIECGFGIELDVQLTKDGKLAVIHDDNLLRMCGVNMPLRSSTYDEIKGYKVAGTNEHIPTLENVLAEVGGRVPIIIDIKAETDVDAICRKVGELLEEYQGEAAIQSFSPYVVEWFKNHKPNILRGQLAMNFFDPRHERNDSFVQKLVLTFMLMNFKTQPDFISYDFMAFDSPVMKIMRGIFGAESAGWSMTSQTCIDDLVPKKFDIVIFEGFVPKEKDNILY